MENKFSEKQDKYIRKINFALEKYIQKTGAKYDKLKDAMLYSLMAGGKRIRGILVLEFASINNCSVDIALQYACAIEMIHCYSLIHDDLPCMDNDDLRRGKPSCHKKFDEATALLAGDALLTLAFEVMSDPNAFTKPENALNAVNMISYYAGMDGMIGGQTLDLELEGKTLKLDEIKSLDMLKTSALLACACSLGCICSNCYDLIDAASQYASNLGMAFQIVDDILDVTGNEKILGKPTGSDNQNQKCTYATLLGVEGAQEAAEHYTGLAFEQLEKVPKNDFLKELTNELLIRVK